MADEDKKKTNTRSTPDPTDATDNPSSNDNSVSAESGSVGNGDSRQSTTDSEKPESAAGGAQASEIGSQDDDDDLEPLAQQLASMQDKYLRLMAEFDNYKRRSAKEFEKLIESANERLMVDIIEIRETFVRALETKGSQKDFDTYQEGMKLIFTKMDDILRRHGLQTFAESGEPFDPLIHDAMLQMPHPEIPRDHIAQIYEKGYN
jgi:molecular chaperone GrpE